MTAAASEPVSAEEFRERLGSLCRGTSAGFPSKGRDRHILFRCAVQRMSPDAPHPEHAVNAALARWIAEVCPGLGIDHVTLRRYLVDASYLTRDRAGSSYRVEPGGRGDVVFDPEVEDVDPIQVLRDAEDRAAARKRDWMEGRA